MRGAVELVEGFAKVPPMAALKGFGRYGSPKRQRVRAPIVENKASMQIAEAWEKYRKRTNKNYELAVDLISGIDYSSGDVSCFCTTLNDTLTEEFLDVGIFISALVNMGNDPDYILPLDHFNRATLICGLGYKNIKNVTIHGNIRYDFCLRMERG